MRFIATFLFIVLIVFTACKKDKATDQALYKEISESGFTFFKQGALLSAAAPSPHGSFKLRFNSIAQMALDSSGKLPVGKTFPSGSIIVKDIYSGSDLTLYAIMKKDASHKDASNGWVWAEIKPSGSVSYTTGKKGSACVSCHSETTNRDLVRTFDLH